MIIIFNITGALVGILGLFVGLVLVVITGSLALGLTGVSGVWLWLGRSKKDEVTGVKQTAPSLFFIPLFYWGILSAVLVLPAIVTDVVRVMQIGKSPEQDLIAEQFRLDEAGLRTNASDDRDLSNALVSLISQVLPGERVNVRVKSSTDSVLVLMQLKSLKEISDSDREKLLIAIRKIAENQRPGVKVFVGIKGRLLYGAISTPTVVSDVGSSVEKELLYDFYPLPVAPAASPNETPTAPTQGNNESTVE